MIDLVTIMPSLAHAIMLMALCPMRSKLLSFSPWSYILTHALCMSFVLLEYYSFMVYVVVIPCTLYVSLLHHQYCVEQVRLFDKVCPVTCLMGSPCMYVTLGTCRVP